MIISHEHKFICIDPPKTGTNYRQNILIKYGEYIKGYQHANFNEIKNLFPDMSFEDYFVFTFVRNPWRRYFSWFNFLHRETPRDQIPPREFSVFIKTMLNEDHLKISKPQSFWFMDKGNINVDFIGSLENMTQDMNYILNRIGLPIHFSKKSVLQSNYKLNFHHAYNQDLIDYVADKEKSVISLMDYKYE
jgi:hypothetical protein